MKFKPIFFVILFAVFTAMLEDYFSKSLLGKYISIILLSSLLLILLLDFFKGVLSYLFISLIIPQFSRSLISEVVESNNSNISNFYSFHSTTVAGFALPILFVILAGTVAIFKLYKNNCRCLKLSLSDPITIVMILTIFLLFSTFINIINGQENELRNMVSDMRLVIVWFFGILIYKYISYVYPQEFIFRNVLKVLVYSVLVIGLRTILFFILDRLNNANSYDFATQPYIGYPMVFAFIYSISRSKYKLFLISISALAAFSLKRSDLAFVAMLVFIYFFVGLLSGRKMYKYAAINSIFYALCITVMIGFCLSFFAQDALLFLLYKLNFFTTEMWQGGDLSNSALVRQLELLNIFYDSIDKVYPFFIGHGLGGYFNFDYIPRPSFIGISDYSSQEILSNKFTRPHTFLNFIGLKGGVFYIIFYIYLIILLFVKSFQTLKVPTSDNKISLLLFFSIGYTLFCLNMFWQPVHSFLFIFILSLVLDYSRGGRNVNYNS